MQKLADEGQIFTYKHKNFWKPMDTLKDKISLQNMWDKEEAPWKIW